VENRPLACFAVRRRRAAYPPCVVSVVSFLAAGSRKGGPLILTRSASHPGVLVKPIEVSLGNESAADTLALIEAGEVALCVLPWVVLMRGGGESELIERWKGLAGREPDVERRAAYRAFALVFAELIPELVNWQHGLEGWEVRESQYLKSFEDRGEVKRARADLLRVLRSRLGTPAPEPIRLAIEGTNDLGILDRWFDAALAATSWDEFQALMKQG
jgi:hypothetical protein